MPAPDRPSGFALHATGLPGLLSREEMVARGAYGFLSMAVECEVPLDLLEALTPPPVCAAWGTYSSAEPDARVIEAKYSADEGLYLMFNGATCLDAARQAGRRTIRAFIEPDKGEIGPAVRAIATGEPRA